VGMAVDDGLIPRQGFVHMGYDLRAIPGRLVIEPRLDLGLGGPIARAYSGVGAYLGGAASGRVRLWGVDDSKTEFNIIGSHLDLVLAARGGAWAPPEGSSSTRLDWEASVELGVRVAIISDVPSGPAGRVQAPVTPAAEEGGE